MHMLSLAELSVVKIKMPLWETNLFLHLYLVFLIVLFVHVQVLSARSWWLLRWSWNVIELRICAWRGRGDQTDMRDVWLIEYRVVSIWLGATLTWSLSSISPLVRDELHNVENIWIESSAGHRRNDPSCICMLSSFIALLERTFSRKKHSISLVFNYFRIKLLLPLEIG